MKKTILTLALSLFALISFSQETSTITVLSYTTYKGQVGKWNKSLEKYDYGEFVYSDIIFKFYDDIITITNESNSFYRIKYKNGSPEVYKDIQSDYKTVSYSCIDGKGRNCMFNVTMYKDGSTILYTIYDDICFVYFVKNSLSRY